MSDDAARLLIDKLSEITNELRDIKEILKGELS